MEFACDSIPGEGTHGGDTILHLTALNVVSQTGEKQVPHKKLDIFARVGNPLAGRDLVSNLSNKQLRGVGKASLNPGVQFKLMVDPPSVLVHKQI